MPQHVSDILRGTKLGNGASIFRKAVNSKVRLPSFGRHRAEDKVNAGRCTCKDGPNPSCPWHLGRHSELPQPGEEIPRIKGLSNGAWALFLVVWRGIHNMRRMSARKGKHYIYAPGRLRLSRAVGGRNKRTRERDEMTGGFAYKVCWEKGACDLSTVSSYLRELEIACVLDTGVPIIKVIRRCRYEAEIVMQRELLEPTKPSYKVVRPWEVDDAQRKGFDLAKSGQSSSPHPSGEVSGDGSTPYFGTPHRLGCGNTISEHDVGTYKPNRDAELAVLGAYNCGWWKDLVDEYGSKAAAGSAIRRVWSVLEREGVPLDDLTAAYRLLTEQWVKGRVPKSFIGWLINAARKRLRPADEHRELEPVHAAASPIACLADAAGGRVEPVNDVWAVKYDDPDYERHHGTRQDWSGYGGGGGLPTAAPPQPEEEDASAFDLEALKARLDAQAAVREQAAKDARVERNKRLRPWAGEKPTV